MATNAKPVYKRILLKLSGEALQGTEGFGIDASILDRMAQEIKELVELGIQVGVVIGGGNLFRGAGLAKAGMNRVVGDHMGMLATVMNGLAMRDALHRRLCERSSDVRYSIEWRVRQFTAGQKLSACCATTVW
ncbi:uridylate kinase [Escherichia coli]|uniref:UMP kinase n=1 Tax=Escherichia coli TaxID=562 RepID=A0A2X1JMK9_ECOLX|nr:uridylate kinase [Escherichia coli]